MLLFDMCREMGIPHPDYLLQKLNSRQLKEWQQVNAKRPFSREIDLYMMARLTAMVAASTGQKVTVEQFLPWKVKHKKHTPEQLLSAMPGGQAAMQELLDKAAEKGTDGSSGKPDNHDECSDGRGDEEADADGQDC